MFKKFFRNLTQSSENKRRSRYLKSLEEFADRDDIQQTDHLSDLVGLLAMAKQKFDQAAPLHEFGEKQNLDFDPLGEAICDEARKIVLELANLYEELPPLLEQANSASLEEQLAKQLACLKKIHTALAALNRCGSDKPNSDLASLSEDYNATTPLGQAIEKLLIEVRTYERIRFELGG